MLIHWIVIYPVDSAIQLLNNWGLSNYTKTIILLRLSEYCGITPSTRGLFHDIHFAFGE